MSDLKVIETVAGLRASVSQWKAQSQIVALVPTMGALHEGHISLVNTAKQQAERVIVSIFVNPTQFAPNEDFSSYPRTLQDDLNKLNEAGVDAAYVPAVEQMYGQNFATTVSLKGPATAQLEDRFRPTHFAGVATVVAKLLNQCAAHVAVFGQKDYQQVQVIAQMVQDLDIATRLIAAPTLRENDGLALSSRNRYLSADERQIAPRLHQIMQQCAAQLRKERTVEAAIMTAQAELVQAGFQVDYIEARQAETLAPIQQMSGQMSGNVRLLAAAKLGRTRLIDNIEV